MNKQEFLTAFQRAMDALGVNDRAAHYAFFEELFDDMTEEGVTEGEIVAKLGDPWKLAESLFHEEELGGKQPPQNSGSTAQSQIPPSSDQKQRASDAEAESWSAKLKRFLKSGIVFEFNGNRWVQLGHAEDHETVLSGDGITELEIEWFSGELEVFAGQQSDILLNERRYENESPLRAEKRGSCLYIVYSQVPENRGSGKELTVTLPNDLANSLRRCAINGVSANVSLSDLRVHDLAVNTVSGDQSIHLTAEIGAFTSSSGDLDLSLEGTEITVSSASGDISLEAEVGGSVKLSSSSGDIDCWGTVGHLSLTTASGDMEFSGLASSVRGKTASGDCNLTLKNTPQGMDMTSVSGDLDVCLPSGAVCQLQLSSRSGDVHFSGIRSDIPNAPVYTFTTISGDIDVHS